MELETDDGILDVRPGSSLNASLILSTPEGGDVVASFFVLACETGSVDPQRGPLCRQAAFSQYVSPFDATEPAFRVTVPEDYDAESMLLQGLLCPPGAEPALDVIPEDGVLPPDGCSDGQIGTVFSLEIPVASEDWPNQLPVLVSDNISLNDQPWPLDGGCDMPNEQVASVGETKVVQFGPFANSIRELTADGEQERLLLSHFTTHGEWDRQFSIFDDLISEAEVEWIAPETPLRAEETTVHFDFVLRDGRLGMTRVRRQLCIR
ncbi:MAG: hypothetical protein AAF550_05855 [Myxococcota bacterium]